jgi:hypothetical protein
MRSRGISDHVFHEYGWGGYMVWNAPQIKTFIDGRADIFVYNGVFDDYVKVVQVQQPLEILDRYQIRYALLQHDSRTAYLIGHTSCWQEIYKDKVAVIYQREREQTSCRLTSGSPAIH